VCGCLCVRLFVCSFVRVCVCMFVCSHNALCFRFIDLCASKNAKMSCAKLKHEYSAFS